MDSALFNRYLEDLATNESSFRKIYEYYLPKIKYRITSQFGGKVDYEDVAHDFFVRLIKMQSLPYVENPTAWVYKSCENIARDILSRRGITLPLDAAHKLGKDDGFWADGKIDFFSLVNSLEEDDRQIVTAVLWDGYNLKEVAETFNISHSSARQKYSRAIKKLKKQYGKVLK